MLRNSLMVGALCSSFFLKGQNDQDALRYSQLGFGGTSRSKAMAGSFGALGADGACMSINPAGIGLYKKGDFNVSAGLRFNSVDASFNNTNTSDFKSNLVFDGFSYVKAWDGQQKPENHHAFGIGINALQNFNSNTTISGYSNHSRTQDMMAQTSSGMAPSNLDPSYAGLAFNNFVLDTMTSAGDSKFHYYSFVDPTKTVKQTDQIQTSGRYNELCFNYAYAYQEKFYLGATLGIPLVTYNYSSTYKEADDKDSMRIVGTTSTYPYDVYNYSGYGGFKDYTYTESYKTSGTGYNLKIGGIYRVTDYLRVGLSMQTPTILKLTDTYVYQFTSNFDDGGTSSTQYPANGGQFSYKIVTPGRLTGSVAYIYKKLGAINVDYETVDYGKANIQNVSGGSYQADFSGVNSTIRSKYQRATNLRIGVEANVKPVFIRLGYAMYGSPYGDSFSGSLVRNYFTGGIGYKGQKFYIDMSLMKQISKDTYYMFNPKYADKSILSNSGTTIAVTIGCKF